MSNTTVLHIVLQTPLRHGFDYLPPEDCDLATLKPGMRVKVPFRQKELIGILLSVLDTSEVPLSKLKPAVEILDEKPLLSEPILKLARWTSNYYHHSLGDTLLSALPAPLRKGKPAIIQRQKKLQIPETPEEPHLLNEEQQIAVKAITDQLGNFQTFLLEGITGSGKTEVYLQAIDAVLKRGQQALVLIPEIGLTGQTVSRFQQRFPVPIALLHSKLNDTEKTNAWIMAETGKARIVIGTRSAIFTPIPDLGIIIIDESHDISFKQQDGLRYSARNLAIIRGKQDSFPVVLGSATPTLESLYNIRQGRYQHLVLKRRAAEASLPDFKLLNIRDQRLQEGLSDALVEEIKTHLANNNQVLIFLNRRGYAPTLICHHCGWMAVCAHCDARMTLHQSPRHLHCHHCNSTRSVDRHCASCHSENLIPLGMGTEKLEETLTTLFPQVTIARIDRDSTRRKGSMKKLLDDVNSGKTQLLIGTQMLAKGHHFPNVTLVAILDADAGFFSADFRAEERMAQLLLQVAGRAGRAKKKGIVCIQTRNPEHPSLQSLIHEGYTRFTELAFEERRLTNLPPFSHLALLRAESLDASLPTDFLETLRVSANKSGNTDVFVLGPIPAPMHRKAGKYRAQLLLQSNKRQSLQRLLTTLTNKIDTMKIGNKLRWSLDVDPMEMY